jgi:diacylglycerol kinase family enzyme
MAGQILNGIDSVNILAVRRRRGWVSNGASQVCVIFNPASGKGRAEKRIAEVRDRLGSRVDLQPTQGPGHAEKLALEAAQQGYGIVAAAGGDGTVHEVANGILRSERLETALAVLPVGSANDYAHSIAHGACWETTEAERRVDVGLVRAAGGRERYFVNGLGLGFNGAVTLESRQLRRLQGVALYGVALLRALWRHYRCPMTLVHFDETIRHVPTLAVSVALGRREGNFVLAPKACLDDGLFDYLHAGAISRWELFRNVPGMITGNIPADNPSLWLGRCRHVDVQCDAPLIVHVDGEFFCLPEDQVRGIAIELLPRRLRICTNLLTS